MKKNIIFICICVLFLNCTEKISTHKKIIDSLSREPLDLGYPSRYEGLYLFLDCEQENEKKKIYPRYIKTQYIEEKCKVNYKEYVIKVFDNRIDIKNSDDCFKLSQTVIDNYNEMDFDSFLSYYCYKEHDLYRIKENVNKEDIYSILYYLFLNEYYTFGDDYIGIYSIVRIK